MAPTDDLPDHIGWDLHRVAAAWKAAFHDRMVAAGYPQFSGAPGRLLGLIAPGGTDQAQIGRRAGLSRQATQQLLDILEADGLIERQAHPSDPRKKRVVYTDAGRAMQNTANEIKNQIEAELENILGADRLQEIKAGLRALEDVFVK